MINCGLCELHSAFSIVMVTIAHQLGTILTQEVLGSLLAGYKCAFGSDSLLFRASGDRAAKQPIRICKD
jgi:hypothetical protein